MMLERVTRYLTDINDTTRLDLARRCFYLKVCEKLSLAKACVGWRREILSQLVSEWGWSEERLAMLDNRANWKIERVREAHNELLDAMMQSYRNLIRFARRNNLSVSASPQDIGVLTRKLYAAFEALPGKVTLVNPQISPDLSENDLTFIHVPVGRANRTGWYLYNQAPAMDSIVSHQPLEYNRYLNKLVAGLFQRPADPADPPAHQERQPVRHRQAAGTGGRRFSSLPAAPAGADAESAVQPVRNSPSGDHRQSGKRSDRRLPQSGGALRFPQAGRVQLRPAAAVPVGSIDLLYRNSWNEVRTLHFSGEQSVLEALKTILGKMHQDAAPPESVEVFCYSQHLRGLIRTRIQQLVSECIELRLSSTRRSPAASRRYASPGRPGLFFERLSVSVQKLENAVEFYGAISNNKLHGLSIKVETDQVHLPPVVDGFASEGSSSSSSKTPRMTRASTSIFWTSRIGWRCITTARAVKRSWCATSAASTPHRTIVLPTAPASSTSTCRSSIRSCSSTGARR